MKTNIQDKWKHYLHTNICIVCDKEFLSVRGDRNYCSRKCISTGEHNGRWLGGKQKNSSGYILVYSPNHPFKSVNNNVLEHRLVMEKVIGRYLNNEEEIHHINGIKNDNRPENLRLFSSSSEHQRLHNPKGIKVGVKKLK